MTREQFLQLAAEYRLGHVANELLSTSIPAVRVLESALRPAQAEQQTFLGGTPLPSPKEWPRHDSVALTFVGQVATASIPPAVCPVLLPLGILQFFVPPTPENHDYEPSLDCGRVIFVDASEAQSQVIVENCSVNPPQSVTKAAAKPSLLSCVAAIFRSRLIQNHWEANCLHKDYFPSAALKGKCFRHCTPCLPNLTASGFLKLPGLSILTTTPMK